MELSHALPDQFDFYHLGNVTLEPEYNGATPVAIPVTLPEDAVSVAFQMSGDISAALVLQFDKGLDASLYSELGNVIASRMATNLSKMERLDVLISPPRVLTDRQWQNLLNGEKVVGRTYLHLHKGISIRLQTILISSNTEKTGHA